MGEYVQRSGRHVQGDGWVCPGVGGYVQVVGWVCPWGRYIKEWVFPGEGYVDIPEIQGWVCPVGGWVCPGMGRYSLPS